MFEFAMNTKNVFPFVQASASPFDLDMLELQAQALEQIAGQIQAQAKGAAPLELQPQYDLAKKRLLEEVV